MTKEELKILTFHATRAYKALKDNDNEKCFRHLWHLNYTLGLLDRDFLGNEIESGP